MYETILITLEGTPTDRAIIDHVKRLAAMMKSRVVLLHVVTGAAAQWHGPDAAGEEVSTAQLYVDKVKDEFATAAIPAEAELAYGSPPSKLIVKWIQENPCDLVAMSTHGHRLLGDLFLGATASEVQHSISVPVLLLRAK
jgi:nucleotide-binding universal stress UspA family protein